MLSGAAQIIQIATEQEAFDVVSIGLVIIVITKKLNNVIPSFQKESFTY